MSVARVFREARQALDDAGLRGSFLVRDLRTGEELGLEPDLVFPASSLVKVPLAVATLERIARGELSGDTCLTVRAGRVETYGPAGLSRFRHPATVAIDDLLYLSTSLSDSAAADALLDLTPPAQVTDELARLGIGGVALRHRFSDLTATPADRFPPAEAHLAQALAINGGDADGATHPVAQLDTSRASTGTARAFVDLLAALWLPSAIDPAGSARVRALMAANVHRQRLAPDLASDSSQWSSKTGTLLNLRHEVGVVEHADGGLFAVAALTASRVPATVQPAAEATMGRVARLLHDRLRAEPY